MAGRVLFLMVLAAPALALTGCDSASNAGGPCSPGDSDGVVAIDAVLDLVATDTGFSPTILNAQNLSRVTLTLTNAGTRPHGFVVDCLPTPNASGCPSTSCFPDAAALAPLEPDARATAIFSTPNPEGIYTFRSDVPGDTRVAPDGAAAGLVGQFIVQ
jgi:hypothetical protein